MRQLIIVFFCLTCIYVSLSAQNIPQASSLLETQLEDKNLANQIELQSHFFPNKTQLSIAIVNGDMTNYIGVIRNNDTLTITENQDLVFEIGSVSKVFTSILFSKLIHDKKLSLDEKLTSILPYTIESGPDDINEITLEMLANHTSGLPKIPSNLIPHMMADQHNPYKAYAPQHMDEYLKNKITLDTIPGAMSAYSNLGTGLLGYVLTLTSKKSFEEMLQEYIFQPLDMKTSTSLRSEINEGQLVLGLYPDGKETSNWDFTDAMVACGGIKSNATDMVKFVRKNLGGDVIYNLTHEPTFTINESLEIGLGWHITKTPGDKMIWHNGGTGGYRSCMILNKKSQKAVIVLSNVSAYGQHSQNIDLLAFEIIKNL